MRMFSQNGFLNEKPALPQPILIAKYLTLPLGMFNIASFGWGLYDHREIKYDIDIQGIIAWSFGANVFSFLWSTTSLVLMGPLHKRLHLGWHIAFDLLSWGFLVATGVLHMILLSHHYDEEKLVFAASCLTLVNGILHFGLMVWACRKLDMINKARKASLKSAA